VEERERTVEKKEMLERLNIEEQQKYVVSTAFFLDILRDVVLDLSMSLRRWGSILSIRTRP